MECDELLRSNGLSDDGQPEATVEAVRGSGGSGRWGSEGTPRSLILVAAERRGRRAARSGRPPCGVCGPGRLVALAVGLLLLLVGTLGGRTAGDWRADNVTAESGAPRLEHAKVSMEVQLQEAAGCPAADWQMGRMEPPMVEDERKEGNPDVPFQFNFDAEVTTSFGGFEAVSDPPFSVMTVVTQPYSFDSGVKFNTISWGLLPLVEPPVTKVEIGGTNFIADTVSVFQTEADVTPAYKLVLTGWSAIGRRLSARRELDVRRLQQVFRCPDGCEIPIQYVNDDFCDCSNCADELDWTCGTCGAAAQEEENTATGVGVGVGVGTALALGIGLGVGLGTGVGAGAGTASSAGTAGLVGLVALAAQGLLRLQTQNTATLQDPNVVNALKDTIARLSGSGIAAAMVELIINCANAGATSDMSAVPAVTLPSGTGQPSLRQAMERPGPSATPMLRVARRLQAMVGVCFQVQVEDSSAEEVCQTLSSYDTNTVQTVLSSELLEAGVNPEEVSVVGYDATPNPRSYNPLEGADTNFFAPAPGIDLGRL
ncbi:Uncharacterized protein SCF082_LOCUS7434 [Durusdinium trenchii]|uniref:Uncharacterized protein n=1 Tax=Durusdinium trenchii TaxID=1381693 RepID=A0ABP0IJ69_9DINO